MKDKQEIVSFLRRKIDHIQDPPCPSAGRNCIRSGCEALDSLFPGHGFPVGHIVELIGGPGGGKTTLAFKLLTQVTRRGQLAAVVEYKSELFPMAVAGINLRRLLIAHTTHSDQALRAATLLAGSGVFGALALDIPCSLDNPTVLSRRLGSAAQRGRCIVLALGPLPTGTHLDGAVRILVARTSSTTLTLTVTRNRLGLCGGTALVQLNPHDSDIE